MILNRWTESHPTASQIREAVAAAPRRTWLIAGTSPDEPYPCRCHESKFGRCHPAFCPCSGRLDPAGPECCAVTNTPERAAQAAQAYARKRAAGTA
jgi:hypothetical protein